MRSDNDQRDLIRESDASLAQAYRVAAETALRDDHFTLAERERRAEYYLAQARRYETGAGA